METILLKYGSGLLRVPLQHKPELLIPDFPVPVPAKKDIEKALASPIESEPLAELARGAKSALIVVPDYTRVARCDLVLPTLLKTLENNGIPASGIRLITANGTHRRMEQKEIACIVGGRIFKEYEVLQHDCRDSFSLKEICTTSRGTRAHLSNKLFEHDLVITIGAINAHYFAGFGGGRKMIFPGLAGRADVIVNHLLSIDFEHGRLAEGVRPCNLEGNPVHEDMMEIVEHCPPGFSITTMLTLEHEIGGIFAGNWKAAHEAAIDAYMRHHTAPVNEPFDAVIASCGGYPKDTDLIQTQKSIQHAARALKPGGRLLLFSQCADGLGTKDFDRHFPMDDPVAFCRKVKESPVKNGQTALALSQKAREYEIAMFTGLPADLLETIGIKACKGLDDCAAWLGSAGKTAFIPEAAVTIPVRAR